MLAHDSICICICWYLHLLLEMWKSKEMLRELFDICKGVLVASAASWSCFLEGRVLQCLVYLNECCIKGYKKCGFLCLCFPNLFKPFPRSLALACSTTKLSCLVQALRLGKSHPSYLLGYLVFEAYPFCLLWWSTVPHPFPGRNSISFSLLACWNTAAQVTASPSQTHYFNQSSLCRIIITFTIMSGRFKMQTR